MSFSMRELTPEILLGREMNSMVSGIIQFYQGVISCHSYFVTIPKYPGYSSITYTQSGFRILDNGHVWLSKIGEIRMSGISFCCVL